MNYETVGEARQVPSFFLQGINFQLAAVLLSLGFYTYTEFVLRQKLATVFSACIAARRCKPDCEHRNKSVRQKIFIFAIDVQQVLTFKMCLLVIMGGLSLAI